MPSAVLHPIANTPSAAPLADIQQLAAEGYFQAIAYWLNQHLVPQKVYAQVLEDEVPGRLKILIEFERAPQPERLMRFVCDRLYKLQSEVIQGIHLITRPLGTTDIAWEKSIRIPPATERHQKTAPKPAPAPPLPPSSLKPQTSSLLHESLPSQAARRIVRSQFKLFRAALVTGTAAIALVFGGLTELVVAGKLSPTAQPEPVESPWYANDDTAVFSTAASLSPTSSTDDTEAMAVSFRPASRFQGRTVEAALETIAVVPHDDVIDPADPTVTLMFGGELGLNDLVFEDARSIDNLFSEIDLYQQADVSMLGLAEPLANASTSLQEDFYHRTRPQAVQMLKASGIDIVSLASEGTMTFGSHGLNETLNTLDRQGIYRVGAGRDQAEAHRPEILEVKGQRIAYLGYNPEALKGAKAEKAGVAIASSEERKHIIEDIRAIRAQVDWVVVNYRWGETLDESEEQTEKTKPGEAPKIITSEPADWQRSLAHEAVDAGADLVVGYHPSHIQGAEIYQDRAIAYSLGDFVFDQSPLQDHDTAALRVSLRNQKMKVEFLPVTIRESKLQLATGDRGIAILKAIRNASRDFAQPMRFPAVLQAKPNLKLPDALKSQPSDSEYPSAPDPNNQHPDNQQSEAKESLPAPHPTMQESEALFAPDPDFVPELEADNKGDVTESEQPELEQPELEQPEPNQAYETLEELPYPALEIESVAPESTEPFVDPFLDPYYDSPESEPANESAEASIPAAHQTIDRPVEQPINQPPVETVGEEIDDGSIEPYAEPLVGPISALPSELPAEALSLEPAPAIATTDALDFATTAASSPAAASPESQFSPEDQHRPPRPKVFYD